VPTLKTEESGPVTSAMAGKKRRRHSPMSMVHKLGDSFGAVGGEFKTTCRHLSHFILFIFGGQISKFPFILPFLFFLLQVRSC
jgi:hypothetical protein